MFTPVNNIAEFFIYLRDVKKLSISAIKGYRSMLASVQPSISSNNDISLLFQAFEKDFIKSKVSISWYLDVVLNFLSSDNFEPLSSCSLRKLTLKTLFLVALASAKRVGELQALSCNVGVRGDTLTLHFVDEFRAKTESVNNVLPRHFTIEGLSHLVPFEDDRFLCPVRCLRYYLDRVSNLRGSHGRLFCSLKNPARPMSKNAISYFIRVCIREAHESFDPGNERLLRVRAHDVRGVSTSLAYLRNVSLERVLQAACWRNASLFASSYLRDICLKYGDTYSVGPLVTAQAISK